MENLEPKTRFEYFLNKIAESKSSDGGSGNESSGDNGLVLELTEENMISKEDFLKEYTGLVFSQTSDGNKYIELWTHPLLQTVDYVVITDKLPLAITYSEDPMFLDIPITLLYAELDVATLYPSNTSSDIDLNSAQSAHTFKNNIHIVKVPSIGTNPEFVFIESFELVEIYYEISVI